MILREILDAVINICGQDAGGDFETGMVLPAVQRYDAKIRGAIGQNQQKRDFTLTTVSGTSEYGMPALVRRIIDIEDTTNRRKVVEYTELEFRREEPGSTSTGPPERYFPLGTYGVKTQPSAAGIVSAKSDKTTDSGSRYVRFSGLDSSGNLQSERITLSGTTAVDTTAVTTWDNIDSVSTANEDGSSITGNITIEDAADNTLAVIPPGFRSMEYLWIKFYPIPDSALTLPIRAIASIPPLFNNEDVPRFDSDYHSLLVSGPASELLPLIGRGQSVGVYAARFQDGFSEFKSTQQRRPNLEMGFENVSNAYLTSSDKARTVSVDGVTVY